MLENLAGCLEGKVAWITGSSRGLGRVMADELCRLGAKVAVHGTREDSPTTFDEGSTMHDLAAELSEAHAGDAMATWCDVTDPDAVESVAQTIRDKWISWSLALVVILDIKGLVTVVVVNRTTMIASILI